MQSADVNVKAVKTCIKERRYTKSFTIQNTQPGPIWILSSCVIENKK